jgi:lipopolysaccharide/colanic/teichoic acid biosynthesis glycosyltransferase
MIIIAFAVRMSSPGPVFYRGVRTGRWGVPFRIYKFRTMVDGAEGMGGGTTALGDPRVTPVGRFLRRHKLDEFPQLINVLVGDMAIVGPRPELPQYTEQYSAEEQRILSVRPGITDHSSLKFASLEHEVGGADADRNYEELVLPEKNRLRLHYVDNQSFMGDMALAFQTIARILTKK